MLIVNTLSGIESLSDVSARIQPALTDHYNRYIDNKACLPKNNIKINSDSFLEVLKVLGCLSSCDWKELLQVKEWAEPGEFSGIWQVMRQDLFRGLCMLDRENFKKAFDYAVKRLNLEKI